MPMPWENESGLELPPGATLLDASVAIHLSEFDVEPAAQRAYLLGQVLAKMHESNVRYADLHPGNWGTDPQTGQVLIIDPGGPIPTTLDPREMIGDFIIPYRTFSPVEFNALLAGYVRHGFCSLDVLSEGYTGKLLQLIGGRITSTPDPGEPLLDVGAIMRQLQLTLDNDLVVKRSGELDPAALNYANLPDYQLVLFLLFIWGAPRRVIEDTVTSLRNHLPLGDHGNVLPAFTIPWFAVAQLGELVSASEGSTTETTTHGSIAHSIVSWLTTRSFNQLDQFRELGTLDGGALHPNWALLKVLERPEGFAPLEYPRLLDKIIAIAGYCSELMDAQWLAHENHSAKTTSLAFVWFCVALLHRTLEHPRWDEIRYVRVLRAFNRLSWHHECDTSAVRAASLPELHNHLAVSDAFLRLESALYRNSVSHSRTQGEGNPYWSVAWSALCRAREMLFATEPILVGRYGLLEVPEETRHLLGLVVADYGASIDAIVRDTFEAEGNSPFVGCLVADRTGAAGSFLRELEWIQALFVIIEQSPASFPAFIAKVGEGRAFFESNARVCAQRK